VQQDGVEGTEQGILHLSDPAINGAVKAVAKTSSINNDIIFLLFITYILQLYPKKFQFLLKPQKEATVNRKL